MTPEEAVDEGDLVLVEVAGQLTSDKPVKVRAVREHEGQSWVFIEGSETGVLMTAVSLVEKAKPGGPLPPILPLASRADPRREDERKPGVELDRFTVDKASLRSLPLCMHDR